MENKNIGYHTKISPSNYSMSNVNNYRENNETLTIKSYKNTKLLVMIKYYIYL